MTVQGVIPLTNPVPQALRRFDKYYLVQKLAEGGMAEIFLAKQVGAEGFERDVVVKCMLEHLTHSRDFVEMFLDEARVAARLFHPNIVQITDLGMSDGRYFLCMEYLPGEDLQSVIEKSAEKNEPVPLGIAAKIILNALEGLEYAHTFSDDGQPASLVHRDVSPSNIFVTFQGTVKVLDFGIAKASAKVVQTQPGTVKGKLGYMSPEQARGEAIDPRADLFSLGVTLHELLTGRRVFQKDNEVGILLAMMSNPVPPPSSVRPEIPRALDNIVLRACERDVSKRYPNAAAMREDLEVFLASHVSAAGGSHVATYLQKLFGPEQVKRRTQIPSLKELTARGFVLPPDAPRPVTPVSGPGNEAPGFEKTFVRGAPEPAAAPSQRNLATDVIGIGDREKPGPPVAEKRGGRGVVIALSTVALLAIGGAGAVIAGVPVPFLHNTPPPPPPLDVVAPPPADPVSPNTTGPETTVAAQDPGTTQQTETAADPAQTEQDPTAEGPGTEDPKPVVTTRPPRNEKRIDLGTPQISAILSKKRDALNDCAQKFQADVPAAGLVEFVLTIESSGKVSSATASDPAVGKSKLGACLSRRLTATRFPKNTSDSIKFKLPMRFQHQ